MVWNQSKTTTTIFNGPEANYGPDKHQGANSSFLAVVKGGRWVRLTEPLSF
jgi:branched-chain amino acid transport system substrate-binding protein